MDKKGNNHHKENSQSPAKRFVFSLVNKNPILFLSTTIISVGFITVFIFFARINYVPDLVFSDTVSILYSAALLGIFVVIYSMFTMVLPGLTLSCIANLISGINIWHVLAVSSASSIIWGIILCILLELPGFSWSDPCIYISVTIMAPMLIYAGMLISTKTKAKGSVNNSAKLSLEKNPVKFFFGSIAAIAIVALSMSLPLFFITAFGSMGEINIETGWKLASILISAIATIAISASFIANVGRDKTITVALIAAPILLLFILNITQSFASIPSMVVRVLGLGDINAARLVIDRKTCDAISEGVGQRVCRITKWPDIAVICPVIVRSRIGSQFVLDFASLAVEAHQSDIKTSNDGKKKSNPEKLIWITSDKRFKLGNNQMIVHRVILDKNKVLAWRPLSGIPERDAQHSPSKNSSFPAVGASLEISWFDKKQNDKEDEARVVSNLFANICSAAS